MDTTAVLRRGHHPPLGPNNCFPEASMVTQTETVCLCPYLRWTAHQMIWEVAQTAKNMEGGGEGRSLQQEEDEE